MTSQRDKTNHKDFWELLGKLNEKESANETFIKPHHFLKHFKKMLSEPSHGNTPPKSVRIRPLDYQISFKELETATKILQPGRAVGIDNLQNETIDSLSFLTVC